MTTISVVTGTGTGPTKVAAYDAALADAGVHNYNLVTVSSVIPADATVEFVGTTPDLGPAGNRLTVVQAKATTMSDVACAGLGWTTGPGPGLFYEAHGDDPETVEDRVRAGLASGRELREWTFTEEEVAVATAEADDRDAYAAAVAVAAYGESEPVL